MGKEDLENFLKFMDEQSNTEKENINNELYERMKKSSELLLKRQYDKNVNIISSIDFFNRVIEKENLNDLTDIYLYEGCYSNTPRELQQVMLHAISTIVAFEYKTENINYLQEIIQTDKEFRGEVALEYYLKIGKYHEKFKELVLTFIDKNLADFSNNQQNQTIGFLREFYPKEERVDEIIKKSGIDEVVISYGTKTNNDKTKSQKPIKIKKPWWKIW